jgi:hypothetical protein
MMSLNRMKGFGFGFGACAAMAWLLASSALGSGFTLASPETPAIWYNRAGAKVNQYLTWDDSKRMLILHLAYDRVEFFPYSDQTYFDTFHLAFPSVKLDGATDTLYFIGTKGHRVSIGHLEDGAFGRRVILDQNVQLSADRRSGFIHAAIVLAHGPDK